MKTSSTPLHTHNTHMGHFKWLHNILVLNVLVSNKKPCTHLLIQTASKWPFSQAPVQYWKHTLTKLDKISHCQVCFSRPFTYYPNFQRINCISKLNGLILCWVLLKHILTLHILIWHAPSTALQVCSPQTSTIQQHLKQHSQRDEHILSTNF